MYETKQHKGITNRLTAKSKEKNVPGLHIKDNRRNSMNLGLAKNIIQLKRNLGYEEMWDNITYKNYQFNGKNWSACTSRQVLVPPYKMPHKGTGTSDIAPWNGILLDGRYPYPRNATRLHVINSNFGGLGGNYDGNLHPGSQLLNSHHLHEAENKFKEFLAKEQFDNKQLGYFCSFNWDSTIDNNGKINDPKIYCLMTANDRSSAQKLLEVTVSPGYGMRCFNQYFQNCVGDTNSEED